MSKELFVVYPHQLFQTIPNDCSVILVEDALFFNQYQFHKQKIILHRASMKSYADQLRAIGKDVGYIDAIDARSHTSKLVQWLKVEGVTSISCYDPEDYLLRRRLKRYCAQEGIQLKFEVSPMFLNSPEELNVYYADKRRYFLTDFYVHERKRRSILLEGNNKPIGGKWTFDSDNREKMPKGMKVPAPLQHGVNSYVEEAQRYVEAHFSHYYGNASSFKYPIDRKEALEVLNDFMEHRLAQYGVYQDAIVKEESFLFHALLTPALNIGLIEPLEIIDAALDRSSRGGIPLNSLEGFIRQVMGWREYIRAVYQREGVKERTKNYWGHTRKIPQSFWEGTTGIEPIDDCVKKVNQTAYAHHIERLMILGNFFLLCEFDPDDVYRWFMELFIDSYDWVMVPNVYGMTQFADGGLMSTKPYISGSNYILKMSNYPKAAWTEIWDALFWNFIDKHRAYFLSNPRLGMMVRTFDKMDANKRETHIRRAEHYLQSLQGL